jgi:hypothetical protein
MSTTIKNNYQKLGAVFANGAEAQADKNSLFSAELLESVENSYATMLNTGVLLEPVSYVWDQETQILEITKVVSSIEEYTAAKTFDGPTVINLGGLAGWTYISDQ